MVLTEYRFSPVAHPICFTHTFVGKRFSTAGAGLEPTFLVRNPGLPPGASILFRQPVKDTALLLVSLLVETTGFEPIHRVLTDYWWFSRPLPCTIRLTSPYLVRNRRATGGVIGTFVQHRCRPEFLLSGRQDSNLHLPGS